MAFHLHRLGLVVFHRPKLALSQICHGLTSSVWSEQGLFFALGWGGLLGLGLWGLLGGHWLGFHKLKLGLRLLNWCQAHRPDLTVEKGVKQFMGAGLLNDLRSPMAVSITAGH
jgi:hypothetical protein